VQVADSLGQKPVQAGRRELFNTAEQDALLTAYRRVAFTAIIVEQVSIIIGATD